MTADQPLLQVRNLAVGYETGGGLFSRPKTKLAISDVSFDIHAGETVAFVGESGSGKSTTGRAVLRLVPTMAGTIHFDGQDLAEWGSKTPLSYRRQVQAVFQDPSASLNPRHLISHAMEVPMRRHGITDRAQLRSGMERAFEMVGLERSHLARFPNELSGGQQQRVAIARALVLEPRLIVCDEAVSALDLSTQGQIINLFEELQQQTGLAYLFIAHDLGLVRHIADRVAVMSSGRLVELSDTDELFDNPKDEYTRGLLAATPASNPEGREERREARRAERTSVA
jgi:ABC-type oligopeptide transport system ATPase subunit